VAEDRAATCRTGAFATRSPGLSDELFVPALPYRATGAILMNLANQGLQPDLFGDQAEIERLETIYAGVDALSRKYGKHTVFLGSSLKVTKETQHLTERGEQARRKSNLLKGEIERKRIGIAYLGDVQYILRRA
jgi:hypothetical protein